MYRFCNEMTLTLPTTLPISQSNIKFVYDIGQDDHKSIKV